MATGPAPVLVENVFAPIAGLLSLISRGFPVIKRTVQSAGPAWDENRKVFSLPARSYTLESFKISE